MLIDLLYNISQVKFPMDRAFEEEKKIENQSFAKRINWLLFSILLLFAVFYFSLNAMWLLLGAIINPNYFLVYTSAVGTLVTFIVGKYQ